MIKMNRLKRCWSGKASGSELNTSSSSIKKPRLSPLDEVVKNTLYRLHGSKGGASPEMQIIFIHGIRPGDSSQAYLNTWTSLDDSILWPMWLVEDFQNAQVLFYSYDSSLIQSQTNGRLDLYQIVENLISIFKSENIGTGLNKHCPIFMVGKDVGCSIIQAICIHAKQNGILSNLKGLLFYSPLGVGIPGFPKNFDGELAKICQLGDKAISRVNGEFSKLKAKEDWILKTLHPAHQLPSGELVTDVPEAFARLNADDFYSVSEDFHSISRPENKTSITFKYLKELIMCCLRSSSRNHQFMGLPDYPVGLMEPVKQMEDELRRAPVLGIVGMGGIGKTTLAKQLFLNISDQFEYTCFVGEVKDIPKYTLVDHIQKRFSHWGQALQSPGDLTGKKTLIVMDDVDSQDQLTHLRLACMGEGSAIVITTRNKEVLKRFPSHILHEVKFLHPKDAKRLFCKHLFGVEEIPSQTSRKQVDDIETIISKCGELPLTLEVLGEYLSDHIREEGVWKETIEKLAKAEEIEGVEEDRIWAKLRISYDALAKAERYMFVEVATFFAGQPIEEAVAIWTSNNQVTTWHNLTKRCLVKTEEYPNQNGISVRRIRMHEQLRDLGKKIANTELQVRDDPGIMLQTSWDHRGKAMPEKHFFHGKYAVLANVTLKEGSIAIFPSDLQLLRWSVPYRPTTSFPIDLAKMRKLVVLDLKNFKQVRPFKFPTSLCILKLKGIQSFNLLPDDLTTLLHLKDLEFQNVALKGLPKSVGDLLSLVTLVIRHCKHLVSLPNSICNLKHLQTLIMGSRSGGDKGVKLSTLPARFGQLKALRKLVLVAPNLKSLPDNFDLLTSLQDLELHSYMIHILPRNFGQLTALKTLVLGTLELESLPENFGLLTSLQKLRLQSNKMQTLPENFGQLTALKELDMKVQGLQSLPKGFHHLGTLEDLSIWSEELQELPDSFEQLPALRKLEVKSPKLMWVGTYTNFGEHLKCLTIGPWSGRLPMSVNLLGPVQKLQMDCPNLQILPNNFDRLLSLRKLGIRALELESLPDSFVLLTSLEEFLLQSDKIRLLPHNFDRLLNLKKLVIHAPKLENLPNNFELLTSLQKLDLQSKKMQSLPPSFGRLNALKTLDLHVQSLRTLPDSFYLLKKLVELRIQSQELDELPSSSGQLPALEKLEVESPKLRCKFQQIGRYGEKSLKLGPWFGNLPSFLPSRGLKLRVLVLSAPVSEMICNNFEWLHLLKECRVENCQELQSLPESICEFSSLEELNLSEECSCSLPDSIGQLTSLQRMTISARSLSGLPKSIEWRHPLKIVTVLCGAEHEKYGKFSHSASALFTQLVLNSCDGKGRVPDGVENLMALKVLRLVNFQDLQILPESIGELSFLKELYLSEECSCSLPKSIGQLTSLRQLTVSARSLSSLPKSIERLSSCETITVLCGAAHEKYGKFPQSGSTLSTPVVLNGCNGIGIVPDGMQNLTAMHSLTLQELASRLTLPLERGCVMSMRKLTIYRCSELRHLLTELGGLSSLEEVHVNSCEGLEGLREKLGGIVGLRKLTISSCPNLKHLPRELGGLLSLEELFIQHCQKLEGLPEELGGLVGLRKLTIRGCSKLKHVPR